MKRLSMFALVGILGLSTFSCLNNDDSGYVNYGLLPATSINVHPDSIRPKGEVTNIHVTYTKSNSCEAFVQFSKVAEGTKFKHYIGVYGSYTSGSSCVQETSSETKTLKFTPDQAGEYTLKFWTGNNQNNTPIYDSIVLDIKEK